MLSLLKIRNLALVDELAWELGPGLIGVTGETGAGKSVIVGALKLVLGERADKSLIRSGEELCQVEAVFEITHQEEINAILRDGGLEPCDEGQLIVRRQVSTNGGRQFVNDSPVTLSLLKRLGSLLVDLHGPHDHQSLLSTERQLAMLDAFADAADALAAYRSCHAAWRSTALELDEVVSAEEAGAQELELLRHTVAEIDAAKLGSDDEHELEDRWRRSANAAKLMESAAAATHAIGGDDGLLSRIADLQRLARELERLDPSISPALAPLENASNELAELEAELTRYARDIDADPAAAAALEERMNLVESLKRKYGPGIADVIARRDSAATRLDNVENRSERIRQLEETLAAKRKDLDAAAATLSKLRRKHAPRLASAIASQLKDLGFRQSSFTVPLEPLADPGPAGMESVDFLFGPNPGEPLLPLRQVASSGEISRVMLAVKSALAEQDDTPLMVFDEIDANVGGEVAKAVGKKMAALGNKHQVVAITHFPQVAASAALHFVVEKQVSSGRTRSHLFPVSGEKRISELVRMLGGGGPEARAMAESLISE